MPYSFVNLKEKEGGGFSMVDTLSDGVGLVDPENSSVVSNLYATETYKKIGRALL